jgi:hypothetical protein
VLLLTRSKRLEVLASGLDLPSFAAPGPGGAIYLAEFGAGRISRLAPSGKVTAVASVTNPAGISVAANGDVLAAGLDGSVVRIDPRTHRIRQLAPR